MSCPSTCVYCPSNGGKRWGSPTTNPALRGGGDNATPAGGAPTRDGVPAINPA